MSAMNLPLADAARGIAGAQLWGDGATRIARVHTDTRTLQAGDLFVALRGERMDGAAFLPDAARAGAAAALVDADARAALQTSGLPGIVAPRDSGARRALGELAACWRQSFDLPVIAVTGSNGKTTVTQMTAAILRAWLGEAAHATAGNLNNDIGVPLTVLGLRAAHRAAVVELGMNHPGEIARLAAIAQPTVALVNNAQREHQEFMGTVEAVARENGAAIAALPEHGGIAVYPAHDAYTPVWDALAGQRWRIRFGSAAPGAEVFIRTADWQGDHWQVQAHVVDRVVTFDLHAPGRHNLRNALAAAAAARAAGAPFEALAQGLSAFRPVAGRSRAIALPLAGHALTLIDDSYNANPDSVRALIDLLAELPGPRLLALGDMGEVGAQGPAFHAEVGRYARERGVEALYTHGAQAAEAGRAYTQAGGAPGQARHFDALPDLIAAARAALPGMASVAVKGSRFMRMERVVAALQALAAPAGQTGQEAAHAA
jgi:UDP-N-acetylmuramoyl-tripeptide--D-alanyl-D-alanine ligase